MPDRRIPRLCMVCGARLGEIVCDVPDWITDEQAATHGVCDVCMPGEQARLRAEVRASAPIMACRTCAHREVCDREEARMAGRAFCQEWEQ